MLEHGTVRLTDAELEDLITSDVPVFDLTTFLLGIGGAPASIHYRARHRTVVCGSEEGARIFAKLGLTMCKLAPTGKLVEEGEVILSGEGAAGAVHKAWRLVGAFLEHASGMATRTWRLVQEAKRANPAVTVLTSRKMFPGAKRISIKAILAGGALPHRLGLSETVLVFSEHVLFMGGLDAFLDRLDEVKAAACEKPVCLEVHSVEDAIKAARAGIPEIQMDKVAPDAAADVVAAVRAETSEVKIALAGGINADNAYVYASSGADMLVTTWPYFGKPADIAAEIGRPAGS